MHDLHEAPVSATIIQGSMVERDNMMQGVEGNGNGNGNGNPFSESMVARNRIMSATESRSREINTNAFQQNFNDMDHQEMMAQYSLENNIRNGGANGGNRGNLDYSVDNMDEIV